MNEQTEIAKSDHGNILIVDDDTQIRMLVTKFLQRQGYHVFAASDGLSVEDTVSRFMIDAIILDVMLPGKSGIDVCKQIRAHSSVPIIMLTARSEEEVRVQGLEGGADDYVTKPFSSRELLARLRSVLRRSRSPDFTSQGREKKKLIFDGWLLDSLRRELVSPAGALVDLSTGEYNLLVAFLEHPNRILSREMLMEIAKTRTSDPFDRAIDVQVSRLRRKLEADDSSNKIIKTVRGAGYLFIPKVSFG